jgi:hypothetical protein
MCAHVFGGHAYSVTIYYLTRGSNFYCLHSWTASNDDRRPSPKSIKMSKFHAKSDKAIVIKTANGTRKVLFKGTADECFIFILKNQGQSVDYATTYGGYEVHDLPVIETWTLPTYWASYLINSDPSGLSDQDIQDCDKFISDQLEAGCESMSCIEVGESYFSHRNDATGYIGGDVAEFKFITYHYPLNLKP